MTRSALGRCSFWLARAARAIPNEPIGGEPSSRVERAGLLEQMRRTGHDGELLDAAQLAQRALVEFEHVAILGADDQKRRCHDARERTAREVGTPAARSHGRYAGRRRAAATSAAAAPVLAPK